MLKKLKIDEIYTDAWKAFANVFAKENHQIGKHLTRDVEGVNNSLRARNRRFVRKTTCFSNGVATRKKDNHDAAIAIMMQQRNYSYHTF
jgi:insertion element IS1 protein InsB